MRAREVSAFAYCSPFVQSLHTTGDHEVVRLLEETTYKTMVCYRTSMLLLIKYCFTNGNIFEWRLNCQKSSTLDLMHHVASGKSFKSQSHYVEV